MLLDRDVPGQEKTRRFVPILSRCSRRGALFRLDRQHAEDHRLITGTALFPAEKEQPVVGTQQGTRPEAGKAGPDDRCRPGGAPADGCAQLPGGQRCGSCAETGQGVVKVLFLSSFVPADPGLQCGFL